MIPNPYQTPSATLSAASSAASAPTTITYAKSWGAFFLIASIGGAVFGGLLGAFFGSILATMGTRRETIAIVGGVAGFVVSLPISFLAFRWLDIPVHEKPAFRRM